MIKIVNCLQCSRPLQKRGNVQVCKRCLDEEQKVFTYYYQSLSRKLSQLNYKYIAQRIHCDEQRLKNTCHYSMGASTGHRELEGWRRGTCNICFRAQSNPESYEPICVRCLDQVLNIVQSHDGAISKEHRNGDCHHDTPDNSVLEGKTFTLSTEPLVIPPEGLSDAAMTDYKHLYEAAISELKLYKEKYGPLSPSPYPAPHASQHYVPTSPGTVIGHQLSSPLNSVKAPNSDDILSILDDNDFDDMVPTDDDDFIGYLLPQDNANLAERRFGFKSNAS